VISIPLLLERILIEPKGEKTDELISRELYDFLIQPENGPVSKLLLVSPHLLFALDQPQKSFLSQVRLVAISEDPSENWHLPIAPVMGQDGVTITVHNRGVEPGQDALMRFQGGTGNVRLEFPILNRGFTYLGSLHGLKRTVFECHFDPPIQVREKRWLRVIIEPSTLVTPAPITKPSEEQAGLDSYRQLLDIRRSVNMKAFTGGHNNQGGLTWAKKIAEAVNQSAQILYPGRNHCPPRMYGPIVPPRHGADRGWWDLPVDSGSEVTDGAMNDRVERFEHLVSQCKETLPYSSSITEWTMQPHYQQIIGMGPSVTPLLLQELMRAPDHWFWALKSVTGEDPVPPEDRGNLQRMTKAWLDWGKKKGYLADASVDCIVSSLNGH
jgi:hypothetical protein